MSSNMIKAYSIAYDTQKIKNLDMEERESEIEERAKKLYMFRDISSEPATNGEFVQGLLAEDIGEIDNLEEYSAPEEVQPVLTEQDIVEIKASLRKLQQPLPPSPALIIILE